MTTQKMEKAYMAFRVARAALEGAVREYDEAWAVYSELANTNEAARAFEIFANGTIRRAPGSQPTGCTVAQLVDGTAVWLDGVRLRLPERRYSLATDQPASGIPGRAVFDRDLRDALAEVSR